MDIRKKLEIYMMYEKDVAFLDIATSHGVTVKEAVKACTDVQAAQLSSKNKVKVVTRKRINAKSKERTKKLVEKMKTLR